MSILKDGQINLEPPKLIKSHNVLAEKRLSFYNILECIIDTYLHFINDVESKDMKN